MGGRPKLLNERYINRLNRSISNVSTTARLIKSDLKIPGSLRTIQRQIKKLPNIRRKKMLRKPKLFQHHKNARLKWAKYHGTWTKKWHSVCFSDEKKFNLDGPDGFSYYFHDLRKEELLLSKRQNGGGSIMVFGAFGYHGKLSIHFVEDNMKAKDYVDIICNKVIPFSNKMYGKNWIFQQDNAPVHTSNITKTFLRDNNIKVLSWPSCSPDLNPIENLWGILTRMVYSNGRQFSTINELKEKIVYEWDRIPNEICRNLIETMPKRIKDVIKRNGGNTKW